MNTKFKSPKIIRREFNTPVAADQAISILSSKDYGDAIAEDVRLAANDPALANELFGSQMLNLLFAINPKVRLDAWLSVLATTQKHAKAEFKAIHKGTPYYFAAMAAFEIGDFARALLYFDAALSEDIRLSSASWAQQPSGLFLRLDDAPLDHAARNLVTDAKTEMQNLFQRSTAIGGPSIGIAEFRSKVVGPSINTTPTLRSFATALISYALEFRALRQDICILEHHEGAADPFYAHIFKGTLLFESLLRATPPGDSILRRQHANGKGAILSTLLKSPAVVSAIGGTNPVMPSWKSISDGIALSQTAEKSQKRDDAIDATYALRNASAHNLLEPHNFTVGEYETATVVVFCCIASAINSLP